MTASSRNSALLVLADGTVLEGMAFGYRGSAIGEVVFNTGMVGYPESFTDPSYRGQILTLTYPLIGNYGVPASTADALQRSFESDAIHLSGLIVAEYSQDQYHWEQYVPSKNSVTLTAMRWQS